MEAIMFIFILQKKAQSILDAQKVILMVPHKILGLGLNKPKFGLAPNYLVL